MTAKKTTAPRRKPADRKPKANTPVPGMDLLRPVSEIPLWEHDDLMAAALSADEAETKADQLRIVSAIAKALRGYAYDAEAWDKFCSGPPIDTYERIQPVIDAYIGGQVSPT